jgi:fructokinase
MIPAADYLKLAEEEALWLWNTTDPEQVAKQLPQTKGVLITAGEKGCTYYLQGMSGHHPGFVVDVADTTGAGDAFVAGFVHQLRCVNPSTLNPQSVEKMIAYASAVGALTTMKAGAIAAQPLAHEVEAFLQNHLGS